MALCNKCGKKGLFLKIDARGLCADCAKKRLNDLLILANDTNPAFVLPVKMSEAAVNSVVSTSIQNSMRIMLDSAAIVEKTDKPDTYYSRLDLLRQHVKRLCEFERIDQALFRSERPSLIAAQMDDVAAKSESAMWKRCFNVTMEKVDALKTDRSKKSAVKKFFDLADQYRPRMGADAQNTVEALKRRFSVNI